MIKKAIINRAVGKYGNTRHNYTQAFLSENDDDLTYFITHKL